MAQFVSKETKEQIVKEIKETSYIKSSTFFNHLATN